MQEEFSHIVGQLQQDEAGSNARWGSADFVEGGKDTVILHTHQVQAWSAVWLQAFIQKNFMDIAENIIGPDIIMHHSKLFHKPAGIGAPFPLHQDSAYFPTRNHSMIAAVIHLSDSNHN